MAQSQQRVEGVFAVNRVVGPGPVEAPTIGPERVDEIEARIADAGVKRVMDIRLNNVFLRLPNGTISALTSANAATLGKLMTNGAGVRVEYSVGRRRAVATGD